MKTLNSAQDNKKRVTALVEKHFLYDKLKGILGSENVTDKEILMEAYTASALRRQRAGIQYIEKPKKPDFVVRAGSTEEIQGIVRLANEYKFPIIPMGSLTGQYYEAVPLTGGIMLDMSRMKSIEVDEDRMMMTIEPGVTWAQAYRDLALKGFYFPSTALPASISIMGTTTQAGPTAPLGIEYYSEETIGLEVVLPTGEVLVTGSAALPGAKPEHARAYGPDVGSLFLGAQGTLGIVVKQTLPIYRIPEARHIVTGVFKESQESFGGMVNATRKIILDNAYPEKVWARYERETQEWQLYVVLYGSKKRVESDRVFSERIIKEEGGTIYEDLSPMLETETTYSGAMGQFFEENIFWRARANSIAIPPAGMGFVSVGGGGSFSLVLKVHEAIFEVFAKHGLPISRIYGGRFGTGARYGTTPSVNYTYIIDMNDPEDAKRAKAITEEWQRILFEMTGTKRLGMTYRPSPVLARTLMPMLGEYYTLLKKMKQMLDPNRIMNPGKLMDIEPL